MKNNLKKIRLKRWIITPQFEVVLFEQDDKVVVEHSSGRYSFVGDNSMWFMDGQTSFPTQEAASRKLRSYLNSRIRKLRKELSQLEEAKFKLDQ